MTQEGKFGIGVIVILILVLIGLGMWGLPKYKIYKLELSGQAELAEAEWNKRVAVEEALASKDAAQHLADAEVIRAHGVAEANEIIGSSLKNNDAYLRYLWIQGLHDGTSETIYIPTEAQLPILEATRTLSK